MERQELLSKISETLKIYFNNFSANCLNYFYEEDLRSSLFPSLSQTNPNSLILPANEWTTRFNKEIIANPFRAEYPEEDKIKRVYLSIYGACKFEIAYVENDLSTINHFRLPSVNSFKLRINNFKKSVLLSDYNKLCQYKSKRNFLDIALLFDQQLILRKVDFINIK